MIDEVEVDPPLVQAFPRLEGDLDGGVAAQPRFQARDRIQDRRVARMTALAEQVA
ncbi:hypothetical protein D3C85_1808730 [compost metagenome]